MNFYGEFCLFTKAGWSSSELDFESLILYSIGGWMVLFSLGWMVLFPEKLSRKLLTAGAGVNGHHTADGRSSVPYFEQSSGSALFNDRPLDKACRGEIVQ